MDVLSLIGLTLALLAIIGGNFLEGGHIGSLLNGPAALIVLGGTLGAVLLQTPLKVFRRSLNMLLWVFRPPKINYRFGIQRIAEWSLTARKEGLLGLEPLGETEPDPFARRGLQLLADGVESSVLRRILEDELDIHESRDLRAARVFEGMGGYAPTIGIIGAVMGLIHVMGNLADPDQLGGGIAVAFVATIYGVSFANLLALPIGNKLKGLVQEHTRYREMLIEGLLSIADGESPKVIELKLQGYLD